MSLALVYEILYILSHANCALQWLPELHSNWQRRPVNVKDDPRCVVGKITAVSSDGQKLTKKLLTISLTNFFHYRSS